MNDAFVSYVREDQEVAEKLVLVLQQSGLAVWWDGLLLGGDAFGKTIDAELKRSKCVVVLWSKKSVTSEWVQNEARRGQKHKARLVPVRIDACEEPLEFSGLHTISLEGWPGDEGHPGLTELLDAVHGVTTPPPPRHPVVRAWHALLASAVLALVAALLAIPGAPLPPPPSNPSPGSGGTTPVPLERGGATATGGTSASGGTSEPSGGTTGRGGAPRASGGQATTTTITCCTEFGSARKCAKKTCAECNLKDCG